MKIGVGIATYKRPEALEKCLEAVVTYNKPRFDLFVAIDGDPHVGIARNKNRIISRFKDHDYIIILEDDSYPKRPDWIQAHLEAHEASGFHHFSYPSDGNIGHIYSRSFFGTKVVLVHQHCSGMFQFFTRKVIETCGGFDTRFGLYGWEHMEYSNRIAQAGLTPEPGYVSLSNAKDLIGDQGVPCCLEHQTRLKEIKENMLLWDSIRDEGTLFRGFE